MLVGFQGQVAVFADATIMVTTAEQLGITPRSVWNETVPAAEVVAVIVSITPTCTVPFASAIVIAVGGLFTVITIEAVVVKPELACVPVMTYVAVGEYEAGVPVIDPVVVFKESPLGNEGLTVKLSICPPDEFTVSAVIAVPAVAVNVGV